MATEKTTTTQTGKGNKSGYKGNKGKPIITMSAKEQKVWLETRVEIVAWVGSMRPLMKVKSKSKNELVAIKMKILEEEEILQQQQEEQRASDEEEETRRCNTMEMVDDMIDEIKNLVDEGEVSDKVGSCLISSLVELGNVVYKKPKM
jgi:hypothetical protein